MFAISPRFAKYSICVFHIFTIIPILLISHNYYYQQKRHQTEILYFLNMGNLVILNLQRYLLIRTRAAMGQIILTNPVIRHSMGNVYFCLVSRGERTSKIMTIANSSKNNCSLPFNTPTHILMLRNFVPQSKFTHKEHSQNIIFYYFIGCCQGKNVYSLHFIS